MKLTPPWQSEAEAQNEQKLAGDAQLLFERSDTVVEHDVAEESEWIWRPLTVVTICGLLLLLIYTGMREYRDWLNRPIETVSVEGATRHISKLKVAEQVAQNIDAHILDLDLSAIQDALLEESWINDVRITRTWPPALRVDLIEEVPVARWGNRGLLNHQGDIFWPSSTKEYDSLPELIGPSHETVRIMQQFRDLNSLFGRSNIQLSGLELEARGAWKLVLNNGIEVIAGRDDLMPRLRRFIQVYEAQLANKAADIEQVDIRYTNGVAVKWKKGAVHGTK